MNNILGCILFLWVGIVFGKTGFGPGDQDWGFIDVRNGAHIFYWLYRTTADVDYKTRPLIIWLQGGPGYSATGFGNFEEFGLLDSNLNDRNYSWVKEANVLFIDNPVGTGFSYVDNLSLLTTKNAEITSDLIVFTQEFLENHPEFQQIPLYIFGESYGTKMGVEYALALDSAIKSGTVQAQLKGIALSGPWVSPMDSILTWAPYLLSTGIVDQQGYKAIDADAQATKSAYDNQLFTEATNRSRKTEETVASVSLGVDIVNILNKVPAAAKEVKTREILRTSKSLVQDNLDDLMNGQVRQALNIPDNIVWGAQSGYVNNALFEDMLLPVTRIIEKILSDTQLKVFVFNGQLDMVSDILGTLNWVDRLKWSGAECFRNAQRYGYGINGILEGYYKSCQSFTFYWIDRAGHLISLDNPQAALQLMKDVTNI